MHGIEKLVCSTPSMGMNDGYHAGHFPTWESAVLGFSSARELARLRKEVRGSGQTSPAPQIPGAKPRPYSNATYDARVSAWAVPFPGEPLQSFKALQPSELCVHEHPNDSSTVGQGVVGTRCFCGRHAGCSIAVSCRGCRTACMQLLSVPPAERHKVDMMTMRRFGRVHCQAHAGHARGTGSSSCALCCILHSCQPAVADPDRPVGLRVPGQPHG